jgi:hypothetical protein
MTTRTLRDPDDRRIDVTEESDGKLLVTWDDVKYWREPPSGQWLLWEDAVIWDYIFDDRRPEKLTYLVRRRRADWLQDLLNPHSPCREAYVSVLDQPGDQGLPALFMAVLEQDDEVVKALASAGANPEHRQLPSAWHYNLTGWSPLAYVISKLPDPRLFQSLLEYPDFTREGMLQVREEVWDHARAHAGLRRSYLEMLTSIERYGQSKNWAPFAALPPLQTSGGYTPGGI